MSVLPLCVVHNRSGTMSAFPGVLATGSLRFNTSTWDLCRMQEKSVAVALNPGVFLGKQANKSMSNWDCQQSNKFCCWFFWAPESRTWASFLKARGIQSHLHTLRLPENQFKLAQPFARNERNLILQLSNIQTQLPLVKEHFKRSADKSDAYAQQQKDWSHSMVSAAWNLACAMSFASPPRVCPVRRAVVSTSHSGCRSLCCTFQHTHCLEIPVRGSLGIPALWQCFSKILSEIPKPGGTCWQDFPYLSHLD